MRWQGQRQSDKIDDRREAGPAGGAGPGLRLGGGRGLGLGTIVVALLASWLLGINPMTVLGVLGGGAELPAAAPATGNVGRPKAGDTEAAFVAAVLGSTEDVWGGLFKSAGSIYEPPTLVLFRGSTPTACGRGEAAMGPFYCPGDRQVYIDLAFYDTLRSRLGAPGDFAQAYVIAHEVGHHVQNLMGVTDKVDAMRRRQSPAQANAMSVRVELQADCLAGLWARQSQQAQRWLDQGDIEEALNAASRIGDDALQQQAQGRVVPETFTHGSSRQRVSWFRKGLEGAQLRDCDTFAAREL
ncbi:KPN_02809 family neutral zinc metallopeptidase [Ideonella alba]|uniref:Neutral zinc metallopeptidase n=1 Tax=Ideonella alba TaxID=2824118 RepID=A0A941BEG3_9BURK|nr:neutral zinc metallopeptidase [Ideonella alba]MBQ0929942.1 neutral zinc metallopeptidase [Ideonella alba]